MKSPTPKLSSEERRAAIIKAVRRLFADKGFHGTTTRELAEAAGVSEALLFKHFPNKEALYSAMLNAYCTAKDSPAVERLKALEPSASSLATVMTGWRTWRRGPTPTTPSPASGPGSGRPPSAAPSPRCPTPA